VEVLLTRCSFEHSILDLVIGEIRKWIVPLLFFWSVQLSFELIALAHLEFNVLVLSKIFFH